VISSGNKFRKHRCGSELTAQYSNHTIDGLFQFRNCLSKKKELELINLELKFATKKIKHKIFIKLIRPEYTPNNDWFKNGYHFSIRCLVW